MQLAYVLGCSLLFVLATLLIPVSSGTTLSQRSRTTPTPKRERLPYTPPLSGGVQRERKEGTPPKPVTQRPGLGLRIPTTKRVPHFSSKTTTKSTPCNCNCNLTVGSRLCAGHDKEQETFANQCQLDCYNCTHNKRYKLIKHGEC